MTRPSRLLSVTLLGLAFAAAMPPRQAFAIKQFFDEFKAVYVKDGTPLASAVEEAKCNVCHMGKSKKERNVYGHALAERLEKSDKDDTAKIRKALEEVAALPSDPSQAGSPTFGALLADGKLPAGR